MVVRSLEAKVNDVSLIPFGQENKKVKGLAESLDKVKQVWRRRHVPGQVHKWGPQGTVLAVALMA